MSLPASNVSRLPSRVWEVVVIGAGPAGAVTARELSRRGFATLLVDRRKFPRAKVCGGCVGQGALGILKSLGLGEIVQALGGTPLSLVRVHNAARRSLDVALPGGVALTRRALDHALVGAAMQSGVTFLDGVSGVVLEDFDGAASGRRVRLRGEADESNVVLGRVVVAADGLGHPSLRQLRNFSLRQAPRPRIGLGAVFDPVELDCEPGTIQMATHRFGYVGRVRAEEGKVIVAAALDPDWLRQCGGPGPAIARILTEAGVSGPPLPECDWTGTPALTRRLVRPAARRVLAIGDAAGYVEPFTGEGIGWALADAIAVLDPVQCGIGDWNSEIERVWADMHRRKTAQRQRICRWTAKLLRSPIAFDAAMRLLTRFPAFTRNRVRRMQDSLTGPVGVGS